MSPGFEPTDDYLCICTLSQGETKLADEHACHARLEAARECEHSPHAISLMAVSRNQKESVMVKLGKVSVETRGLKGIEPQEVLNVPFTQF